MPSIKNKWPFKQKRLGTTDIANEYSYFNIEYLYFNILFLDCIDIL